MPHPLDGATLQRIQEAQRVLLDPLRHTSLADWQRAAAAQVQAVMQADCAYSILPREEGLALAGVNVDAPFLEGTHDYFGGVQDGHFLFEDAMPLQMHLARQQGGPGVYHEQDLAERATVEHSPYYQEVCVPAGVCYATGLSLPHAGGEAMLAVAFDRSGAPGFEREAGRRLKLLLPAFEAGLRTWKRLSAACPRLRASLDALDEAIVVFDAGGAERYRNRALRRLLEAEPKADALMRAAGALAADVCPGSPPALTPAQRTVRLAAAYRLHASFLPRTVLGEGAVLVAVARQSLFPPPAHLRAEFGLTPRETEVAVLLAEGRSNNEIAEQFVISEHTARRHTEHVLRKLELNTRAAVAHRLLQAPAY